MDVNYDTQVQPNHVAPYNPDNHGMCPNKGDNQNMPQRVDAAAKGDFDRSMQRETESAGDMANGMQGQQGDAGEQNPMIQQIMEQLMPILMQAIQEMLGGQQGQMGANGQQGMGDPASMTQPAGGASNGMDGASGAGGSDMPASMNGMDQQQASNPMDQMMQAIMQQLMPMIQQMIQSITGEQDHTANDATSGGKSPVDSAISAMQEVSEAASSDAGNDMMSGGDGQMSQQDQLVQQIMEMLAPMLMQMLQGMLGQGQGGQQQGAPAY